MLRCRYEDCVGGILCLSRMIPWMVRRGLVGFERMGMVMDLKVFLIVRGVVMIGVLDLVLLVRIGCELEVLIIHRLIDSTLLASTLA